MTDESFVFQIEADKLMLACKFLSEIDLAGIVSAVTKADTIGAIVDPTRYMHALQDGGMHAAGQLAHSAISVVKDFEKIQSEFIPGTTSHD